MSVQNNQAFIQDAAGFAAAYPILAFDEEQSAPGSQTGKFKEKISGQLYSVAGESRIAAADIKDSPNSGAKYVHVKWHDGVATKLTNDGYMPIYWLPWGRNRTFRTTLRPRSLTARDGQHKANIVLNPASAHYPGQDTNDPGIFVTSVVNGCMIYVEGPQEQPTVYHANAIGSGASPGDLAFAEDAAAENVTAAIQHRVNTMTNQVKLFKGHDPKATRGMALPLNPSPDAGLLTQLDYMIYCREDTDHNRGVAGAGDEGQAKRALKEIARLRNLRASEKVLRLEASKGTVFGVRHTGSWRFYYQKLVRYSVWEDTAGTFQKASWVKKETRWHVMEFAQFWPGNGRVS